MTMKNWTRSWVVCALTLTMAAPAFAQAPAAPTPAPADKPPTATPAPGGAPGVVIADVKVITATVDAIDKDKREVTLKGSGGRTATIKVPPEAKNFDQIKVGDKVTFKFLDSVALFVRKAGDPPSAGDTQAVSVAPRGQKPKAVAVDTKEITAKVEKIDYKQRLVTLKGPEGNVKTIKVDPAVKRLNEVKVGDDIVLRTTEAVAVQVMAPQTK